MTKTIHSVPAGRRRSGRNNRKVVYLSEEAVVGIKKVLDQYPRVETMTRLVDCAVVFYTREAMVHGLDANFVPLSPATTSLSVHPARASKAPDRFSRSHR